MNLQFSTVFPNDKPGIAGKPTHFPAKIWKAIGTEKLTDEFVFNEFGKPMWKPPFKDFAPKIHTIRQDRTKRWKAGKPIHFQINFRTSNSFQFAPVIPLHGKEPIKIRWSDDVLMGVWVNDHKLGIAELEMLAVNDGFESLENFFDWFDTNFDGWILHWTPFRYDKSKPAKSPVTAEMVGQR